MNIDWQPHRIERLPGPANDARLAIADDGTCFSLFRRHDSAKVWSLWSSDRGYCIDLSFSEDFKFPIFSPTPNHGVLVANGLCPWIDGEPPGLNAHLFDADGKVLQFFHAGSSIMDIQVDSEARIWISYFDEGVFSNHGWNGPGPAGLGGGGLVCVDIAGQSFGSITTPRPSGSSMIATPSTSSARKHGSTFTVTFPSARLGPDSRQLIRKCPLGGRMHLLQTARFSCFQRSTGKSQPYAIWPSWDSGV